MTNINRCANCNGKVDLAGDKYCTFCSLAFEVSPNETNKEELAADLAAEKAHKMDTSPVAGVKSNFNSPVATLVKSYNDACYDLEYNPCSSGMHEYKTDCKNEIANQIRALGYELEYKKGKWFAVANKKESNQMVKYVFEVRDSNNRHVENISIVDTSFRKANKQANQYVNTNKQNCTILFTGIVETVDED